MRRTSIKLRVTLWFTAFMLLLTVIVLAFMFSVGGRLVESGSKDTLVSVIADSRRNIEFDDGYLEIDDLDYFTDGVYVTVYDGWGKLLYGRQPSGYTAKLPLESGEPRTSSDDSGEWYVYDVLYSVDGYGDVWVRGVMSAAGGGAFSTLMHLAAIALPFLVLFAAVGGYMLINRAFRPVRQITATAERIGGGKDLSERIGLVGGRDEIYNLAATFDRMFDRLQASFESERQFTSDASHELRTPTSVIISQCEYALERAETVDDAKAALGAVLQQAQRMSALIAQLLTLARADKGQAKLNVELINLSELSELCADQIREQAAEREITVSEDIQPELLIRGDETMLMRMILNLLSNGVKYGRQGGYLKLSLHKNGGNIVGCVEDDGIGVREQELNRIWERFYQADPARSSSGGGMGLGLPMVKYIAEAHGGSVLAESQFGKGSRFTFTLPAE